MPETAAYILRQTEWITYVFLGVFIALTLLRLLYHDRVLHNVGLFVYKRFLTNYFSTEANTILNGYQAVMFVIQVLVISLLIYFSNQTFDFFPAMSGFIGLLEIASFVIAYFLFRFLLGFIVAVTFDFKVLHLRLMFDKTNYLSNTVLLILPLLMVYVFATDYSRAFLTAVLIIFALLLIYRYLLVINNNKKMLFTGLFYFILYLCALEIAPLLLMLKLSV
jgi:hypothetical protein